jgi:hypothetical protein
MKRIFSRRAGVGLAFVAMVALAASPAMASELFCGASWGRTLDVALWGAVDDARNSAQSMGLYGDCTIVGEPEISEENHPLRGHIFRAAVTVSCLP